MYFCLCYSVHSCPSLHFCKNVMSFPTMQLLNSPFNSWLLLEISSDFYQNLPSTSAYEDLKNKRFNESDISVQTVHGRWLLKSRRDANGRLVAFKNSVFI